MRQTYRFFTEDGLQTLAFDDARTVAELIERAFEEFGYAEPLGMDIVTLYQRRSELSRWGWFTTDTSQKCCDEILNPEALFFAYHMPGVFYYVEGSWGSLPMKLENHPEIENAVSFRLRFEGFDNRIVMNGAFRLSDIIRRLEAAGYLETPCTGAVIETEYCDAGDARQDALACDDPMLHLRLGEMESRLAERHGRAADEVYRWGIALMTAE